MELKAQTLLVLLLATGTYLLQTAAQTTDRYTDENRPYEFGFVIEGQQHRHEKKDEAGIITGEFGFITADGIYHVTVYATDENGDFKIISMKNVRVAPSPFGNPDASIKTSPVPIGNTGIRSSSPSVAISTQPPLPSKTASFPVSSTRPPIFQQTSTSPPAVTSTKKTFKIHNGCSNCVIPTTTTTTTTPPPPPSLLNRDNRPPPLPSKPGFPFSSSIPKGPFTEQPPGVSLPRGNVPVPGPQPVDSRRNFITPEDSPRGGQQPVIATVNSPRNQETRPKPPIELQPPISANKPPGFPKTTSGFSENDQNTQGNIFTTKSPFTKSSPQVSPLLITPGGRPPQSSFGVSPVNIPGSVSTATPKQTPYLSSDNSRTQFPNTNVLVPTNPPPQIPNTNIVDSVPHRSPQNPLPQTPNYNYPNTSPPVTSSVGTLGRPSLTPNRNIPVSSSPQNSNNYVPGKLSPQFPNVNTPDSAISGIPGVSSPRSSIPDSIPPQTTSNTRGSLPPQIQPTFTGRQTPSPIGVMRDGPPPGVSISDVMKLLYIFNYTVGFHGHHESGYTNGDKQGGYFVNGRDGIGRNVNYVANEFGYQPNITLVNIGLNSPDTPKQDTEKEFGLKGYEFKWFPS